MPNRLQSIDEVLSKDSKTAYGYGEHKSINQPSYIGICVVKK